MFILAIDVRGQSYHINVANIVHVATHVKVAGRKETVSLIHCTSCLPIIVSNTMAEEAIIPALYQERS